MIWGAYKRLRTPESLKGNYANASTRVLIVGGGFGGLAAARELTRALGGSEDVSVTLLDRVNYTTFWPMVPSVITSNVEVRHVAHSLRRILRPLGVEFFHDEVTGVDFDTRQAKTEEGTFSYDYLILSPGSRTAFFGIPGAEENAMDTKGLRDALRVRSHVIDRFEEAERRRGELPDGLLTFVFVGGGPTGVEAAADTHDLIVDVLKGDYPNVDFEQVRLVLLNADDHILHGLDPSLVHAATRRLASQRIEIINDVKAKEVRPDAVVLSDGHAIPARTIVWAAGIEPSLLAKNLDVGKDHRGHILVDEFLRVKDRSGVYAVGDCTSIDYDGPPVPALAQAAEQEGKRAALNLAAEIMGEVPIPFRYRPLGQLVDLGEGSALVDVLGVKVSGRVGALIWKCIYLYELGYNLNRAQVLVDWTIDLFARPDASKLFEDDKRPTTTGR
ncbi:MAG: NAD(P)/FAD-dependent oxidoreductase [Actinomycetota bacterium]|nr:NAD(P)/FAD-dependent oxidoreductase [Actinomycetota bacterium]